MALRILQVNAVNGIMSTGRTCLEMEQYLNAHGAECYTAYSIGSPSPGAYKIAHPLECKLHALLSRLFGLQGYFSFFSTGKLLRLIKRLQPDVVHLRNLHANYLNIRTLLGYLAKNDIATVVTLHDCWDYTGKCTHYFVQGCDRWQTGCHHCPKLRTGHNSWFFDRTDKMWRDKKQGFQSIPRLAVTGVSDWMTGEAQKSFLSSAKQVKRIYNWVDLQVFRPVEAEALRERLGIAGKTVILGVASGWSNRKGLHTFLKLAELLGDHEIIVLVGNMQPVQLPPNVLHIPATHDVQELVAYYSMADVFLQMSPEETFGKVAAEALACGTPVVAVDSTANSELVDESCGALVPDNENTAAIHQAIAQLLCKDRAQTAEACRAFACRKFDKEYCMQQYVELYKALLG